VHELYAFYTLVSVNKKLMMQLSIWYQCTICTSCCGNRKKNSNISAEYYLDHTWIKTIKRVYSKTYSVLLTKE